MITDQQIIHHSRLNHLQSNSSSPIAHCHLHLSSSSKPWQSPSSITQTISSAGTKSITEQHQTRTPQPIPSPSIPAIQNPSSTVSHNSCSTNSTTTAAFPLPRRHRFQNPSPRAHLAVTDQLSPTQTAAKPNFAVPLPVHDVAAPP
jgi:hypothetical protein